MNETPKVYLDTSVISHLFQDEKPEAQGYTLEFWEKIKQGEFEVYISQVVLDEIDKAPPEKTELMKRALAEINYLFEPLNEITFRIAEEIIQNGILPRRCFEDCLHIAAAITSNCDYLLTWNMKHLAKMKTNHGVRSLSLDNNNVTLEIIPPSML
jgi:predicted nucleic acid-binding protein